MLENIIMQPKECPGRSGSSGSISIFERLMVHSSPFSKQDMEALIAEFPEEGIGLADL